MPTLIWKCIHYVRLGHDFSGTQNHTEARIDILIKMTWPETSFDISDIYAYRDIIRSKFCRYNSFFLVFNFYCLVIIFSRRFPISEIVYNMKYTSIQFKYAMHGNMMSGKY